MSHPPDDPLRRGVEQGSWAMDLVARTIRGDAAFARIAGVDAAEMAEGVSIPVSTTTVHPDDLVRLVEARRETTLRGTPFRARYRRVVDGVVRHMLAIGQPEHNDDGQVVGIRGSTLEMTDLVGGSGRLAGLMPGPHDTVLEACADYLIRAKATARAADLHLIGYFLDMALIEIGRELAAQQADSAASDMTDDRGP